MKFILRKLLKLLLLFVRMLAKSTKSIFFDHCKDKKLAISRRYEPSPWQSIVKSVERMLSYREPSNGYAEYICPHCGTKKKCAFTCEAVSARPVGIRLVFGGTYNNPELGIMPLIPSLE